MKGTDTIFALASGAVPSGVAVVRVSGPQAAAVATSLCGPLPDPGRFSLRTLRDGAGAQIDSGPVLFFRAPASFTGEDIVEFQIHGSVAVLDRLSSELIERGLRPAEAGEFTRRAFENGRLDLTEVEGLGDLVVAETEAQRRLAVAQAGGALRRLYEGWHARLLHLRAMIEAELDFADEEDVPDDMSGLVRDEVAALREAIGRHLATGRDGEIVREGFHVVLLGPPNAGKSSLLNALSGRDAAIVTAQPGTTRDIVRVEIERRGQRVILSDTAGLRASDDLVEREGMARARDAAARADLRVWLSPADAPCPPPADMGDVLTIVSKADLLEPGGDLNVSCRSEEGLQPLLAQIDRRLPSIPSDGGIATRARHRQGIAEALEHLDALAHADEAMELRAEHLRLAAAALGRITGRTDVEDLLDVIFARFCVGK